MGGATQSSLRTQPGLSGPADAPKPRPRLAAPVALTAVIIGTIVVGSVGYMFWAAGRRHWNAGGEDDRRRLVGDRLASGGEEE